MIQGLSWVIDQHRFTVVIEGHTKSGLEFPGPAYTPWELSSDRANAARRSLVYYAVDDELIERVSGLRIRGRCLVCRRMMKATKGFPSVFSWAIACPGANLQYLTQNEIIFIRSSFVAAFPLKAYQR
ncbi:MAG: hypothetical protein J6386_00215 [Candidatus Synoicihabitans palmerolidicus]|nr:hypothetical protein [Candidatus Synoicihabitans palmerolidicus]